MYVKAALEGLDPLPADLDLRRQLNAEVDSNSLPHLVARLRELDPVHADAGHFKPAARGPCPEVCLTSGRPFSSFHSSAVKSRDWHVVSVGLDPDRTELRERIALRTYAMMDAGWLEETQCLIPLRSQNALNTVGYKELFQHLDGDMPLEDAVDLVITHTRQFAKRQMTWFRKDPRTTWFPYTHESRSRALEAAVDHVVSEVARLQGSPIPSHDA